MLRGKCQERLYAKVFCYIYNDDLGAYLRNAYNFLILIPLYVCGSSLHFIYRRYK